MGLDKATSERSLERRGDDRRGEERGGEGKTGKRREERLFKNQAVGHSKLRAGEKGDGKGTAGEVGGRLVDAGVWKQLKKVFQEGCDQLT